MTYAGLTRPQLRLPVRRELPLRGLPKRVECRHKPVQSAFEARAGRTGGLEIPVGGQGLDLLGRVRGGMSPIVATPPFSRCAIPCSAEASPASRAALILSSGARDHQAPSRSCSLRAERATRLWRNRSPSAWGGHSRKRAGCACMRFEPRGPTRAVVRSRLRLSARDARRKAGTMARRRRVGESLSSAPSFTAAFDRCCCNAKMTA